MRKLAFIVLVVFGLISVSFGAWIQPYHESRYQKLKAEVEMWDDKGNCKLREDGTLNTNWGLCRAKNVLAFFDEIRATEVKGAETEYEEISIAMRKVMEMPRFKNDSGIYAQIITFDGNRKARFRSEEGFWKDIWSEWRYTKSDLELDGARRNYWKKMAE